jgi:putative ABC transport system ATP-binding protein
VLADEPTAALDTASARELTEALQRVTASGMTLVVASHDPILRKAADHVVELTHGRVSDPGSVRWGAGFGPRWQPSQGARSDEAHAASWGAETDEVLKVQGARKSYRSGPVVVDAVRDATLSVRSGEVVGLFGRSGSGKTTLLNLIAGWEEADGGAILRPGAGPSAPSWHEVALLPQKLGLLDELTIRANIEYPARLAGRLEELREDVDGLIETLGLAEVQGRHPRETSVGEQQRCALARALVLSPALLLADEPTAHQDGHQAEAAFGAIVGAATEGTAALVATHGEEALPFLDRVLAIADGRVPAPG